MHASVSRMRIHLCAAPFVDDHKAFAGNVEDSEPPSRHYQCLGASYAMHGVESTEVSSSVK